MVSEEEPAGLEGYRNSISPCLQGGKQHMGAVGDNSQEAGGASQQAANFHGRAGNVAQILARPAQAALGS